MHGISVQNGSYNRIISNKIYGHNFYTSVWGITSYKENHGNIISENTISNNWGGIDYLGTDSEISKNNITYNTELGIYLSSPGWLPCKKNTITQNNLIGNGINAFFLVNLFSFNVWYNNYWTNWPLQLPKLILGKCFILMGIKIVPWFNIDWHPAKEPYDIGG